MQKWGTTISMPHERESDAGYVVSGRIAKIDQDLYRKGRKRIGPIKMRTGWVANDFLQNRFTIVVQWFSVKIPRFLNPLRNERRNSAQRYHG
jgi:hypothetical protein